MKRRSVIAVPGAAILAVSAILAGSAAAIAKDGPPLIQNGSAVEVQILAINDFHGNLEPPAGSAGRQASAPSPRRRRRVPRRRTSRPSRRRTANTIVVSAGDLIGASPLLSAPLPRRADDRGDEPRSASTSTPSATTSSTRARPSCCACRTAAATRPTAARTATASPAPTSSSWPPTSCNATTGQTLFAPYTIRQLRRRQGRLHRHDAGGHPEHRQRRPASRASTSSTRPTPSTRSSRSCRHRASSAIVVLLHEGGPPTGPLDINGCEPACQRPDRRHRRRDSIPRSTSSISGHTHQPYNCVIDGIPVTSAYSFGRLVTDIDMRVDRATEDVDVDLDQQQDRHPRRRQGPAHHRR